MSKKISDDDKDLFRKHMGDTKRITQDKLKPPPKKTPMRAKQPQDELHYELVYPDIPSVGSEEQIFFALPGVQLKQLKQLRQGKIPYEASLDLHGMTQDEAFKALHQFISSSIAQGYRCLHVIHGKGRLSAEKPILKNLVQRQLRQYSEVLAFCSAAVADGSRGAVYVLLRRQIKGSD